MREGIFEVDEAIFRYNIETLGDVFAFMKFVPIRCELLYISGGNKFIMHGVSHIFEELQPGEPSPEYKLYIRTSQNNILRSVTAERIK